MWIYRGESLRKRSRLDPLLGFWLDYWLFLNSELTHSGWSARPISLKHLSEAVCHVKRSEDEASAIGEAGESDSEAQKKIRKVRQHASALRRACERELRKLVEWAYQVPILATHPKFQVGKINWRAWDEWLRAASNEGTSQIVSEQLSQMIADKLFNRDLSQATFLTRRLAEQNSEKASFQFQYAKHVLSDSSDYADQALNGDKLASAISKIFKPRPKMAYEVSLQVVPTEVSNKKLSSTERQRDNLVVEDQSGRRMLTGMLITVDARDFMAAAAAGLAVGVGILDRLRVMQYVRTHFHGEIHVKSQTDNYPPVSLPQPFWSPKDNPRPIPRLPIHFETLLAAMNEGERRRWQAARWHISTALSVWAEDPHAAVVHVSHAIESFVENGDGASKKMQVLAEKYSAAVAYELDSTLALYVSSQRRVIMESTQSRCDWRMPEEGMSVADWRRQISDPESPHYFTKWRNPTPPVLLFDRDVGLFHLLTPGKPLDDFKQLVVDRTIADLDLLYALRNKAVHDGVRLFPQELAGYLGRVGLEALLTCMGAETKDAVDDIVRDKRKQSEIDRLKHNQ